MPKIRKIPILQKIKNFPLDFLLNLNEIILSIDWDEITSLYGHFLFTIRFFIGISMNFLFIFCQFELTNQEFESASILSFFRVDFSIDIDTPTAFNIFVSNQFYLAIY